MAVIALPEKSVFPTLVLGIGCLGGCFPTLKSLNLSKKFNTDKSAIISTFLTIYSIISAIILVVRSVDNVYANFVKYSEEKISTMLMFCTFLTIRALSDIFLRFAAIRNAGQLSVLRDLCRSINRGQGLGTLRSTEFGKIATYSFTLSLVILAIHRIGFITGRTLTPAAFAGTMLFSSDIYFPPFLLIDMIYQSTRYFTICFVLLQIIWMGRVLSTLLEQFEQELHEKLRENEGITTSNKKLNFFVMRNNKIDYQDTIQIQRWNSQFISIKEGYKQFQELNGPYLWTLIPQLSLFFMQGSFSFAGLDLKTAMDTIYMIHAAVTLFALCHLGEQMKNQLEQGKANLRNAFLHYGIRNYGYTDPAVELLVGSVLDWKWKLTGNGYFVVNYRLIPSLAGTVLTLIIFIFQLKMSGK